MAAGRLTAAATGQDDGGQHADENGDDLESFHGPPPASFEAPENRGGQHPSGELAPLIIRIDKPRPRRFVNRNAQGLLSQTTRNPYGNTPYCRSRSGCN